MKTFIKGQFLNNTPVISPYSRRSHRVSIQSYTSCPVFTSEKPVDTDVLKMNGDEGNPVLLYAHPSMDRLATQIVERCSGDMPESQKKRLRAERSISVSSQRNVEYKQTIQWGKFNDGFPNLFIQEVKEMAGKDVIFLGSFHSPEVIFEQLSILYAFPRYLAKSFHFILPYFPTGTMERVDREGQIATAKTLATLLSAIPLTSKGPAQIIIFDIHALQERFYFSDNVIPRLETAIQLLQREVERLEDRSNLAFAFPDDGAFKRFHLHFAGEQTIICAKIRDGDKKIVKVKEGNPEGKHVIIIDDLVQTGGTLKECGKVLLGRGAVAISAYVTHPVFPNESWKRFVDTDVPFKNFWITDSIPHAVDIAQHKPFKLLSLCDVVAESLLGYDLMPQ